MDWLLDAAIEIEPENGCPAVCEISDEDTTAFIYFGIENLRRVIEIHKADHEALKAMPSLIVLSDKHYNTDFRKYLLRAAESVGERALHIRCGKKLIELTRNGSEYASFPANGDERPVLLLVRDAVGEASPIVLTGLAGDESSLATRLQRVLETAILVYDVYDDFLYNASGIERVTRLLQDAIWRCRCPYTILCNADLKERYPRAHVIKKASHLRPISVVSKADPRSLVYIGSIDDRVDFAWLNALASQSVTLAIYGSIHARWPQAAADIDSLVQCHRNVTYHGGYDNDDLGSILARFRAGVIPYHADHPMTRYVDPDKLYHYLNAGLEVLSAPIPYVMPHAEHVHLIRADGPWAEVIGAIASAPRRGSWSAEEYSWEKCWTDLVNAVVE